MQLSPRLTSSPRACPFNPAPPLPTFPNKSSTFDRIYATATGDTGLDFSEDCLALNIWTKSISPKELKPVLFFIHGGRFVSGSTNNTLYDGKYLAATGDVVVVTIEYILFTSNLFKWHTKVHQLPTSGIWIPRFTIITQRQPSNLRSTARPRMGQRKCCIIRRRSIQNPHVRTISWWTIYSLPCICLAR